MAHLSIPEDLALHGVRVLGFPTVERIADRYELDAAMVGEALLDFEALGWVRQLSFGGGSGWSLTESGRQENERRLAAELDEAGAREVAETVHAAFLPLNQRFGGACTDWQMRPTRLDPLTVNDHTDWRWDDDVLTRLTTLGTSFGRLCDELGRALRRFDCYAELYSSALRRVEAGQRSWVDGHDRDSLNIVWIQFHEDLLATLGIPRGSDI